MVIIFCFTCWSLISKYLRYLERSNKEGDAPGYLGVVGVLFVPCVGVILAQEYIYTFLFKITAKNAEILTNFEGVIIIGIIFSMLCFGLMGFGKKKH